LLFLLFGIVKLFSQPLLSSIINSSAVYETGNDFLKYRIWGIFFAHTNFIFRAFYVGIGRTRVITFTTLVMVSVNVILDYSLIFGNFGMPQMGVSGAALASVIAEVSCSISFIAYTLIRIPISKYRLFNFKVFSFKLLVRLLRTSIPMMFQNFFSFSVWFVFFLIIEKMGEAELAVSNIIRSIYVILLIPIMGFSSATNTLVSYVIGKGEPEKVMGTIAKTATICTLGVVFIATIISLMPEKMLSIYTNDYHLIEIGVPVVYVVSFSSILLALGFILFNGVSGTGKTNVSFAIEIIILSFYLFVTFILAVWLKYPVYVVWFVEILYGLLLATSSLVYLKSKRWLGKRV
jgi:putative MATE family efflux protein